MVDRLAAVGTQIGQNTSVKLSLVFMIFIGMVNLGWQWHKAELDRFQLEMKRQEASASMRRDIETLQHDLDQAAIRIGFLEDEHLKPKAR